VVSSGWLIPIRLDPCCGALDLMDPERSRSNGTVSGKF
jgi:hypothetical protein